MSLMNLLTFLNIYEDEGVTSNPSKNNVKWSNDIQGITVNEPNSKSIKLNAGESTNLFTSALTIDSDNTTTYDLSLKPATSNTYVLAHNSGTAPNFRTLRSVGKDATTEVTITKNAKLMTITATGGTIFDLIAGGVLVGDEVRLGSVFNAINQGKFQVLSVGVDFLTVEYEAAAAEVVTLGVDFNTVFKIHSADGIQIGNKVDLKSGFSPLSLGTYEITDVADDYVEIYSSQSLPEETDVSNDPEALLFYQDAKSFIYVESDKKLSLYINGSVETNTIEPILVGGNMKPGMFMNSSSVKSMTIKNISRDVATIFYITAE